MRVFPRSQTTQRLLVLCIAFTASFAGLVFCFSISNLRNSYLRDAVARAYIATLVFEASGQADMIDESLARKILDSIPAYTLAVKIHNTRRLLAISTMPPMIEASCDLRSETALQSLGEAFAVLLSPRARVLRVTDKAPMGGDFLEITHNEAALRHSLQASARHLLLTSLLGVLTAALLLACALSVVILNPLQRLTTGLLAFAKAPERAEAVIVPSKAGGEFGEAESALRAMQQALVQQLAERKRLAALGLAVAKINHDLRNLLASAQLILDRLASFPVPETKSLTERLMVALARAIAFCESSLAYGSLKDAAPKPEIFGLQDLVVEVLALLEEAAPTGDKIAVITKIDARVMVFADRGQVFRALLNLIKNAKEALMHRDENHHNLPARILLVSEVGATHAALHLLDTGFGIPENKRHNLFTPFFGSERSGSTGLGLAIAHELIEAQKGSLILKEPDDLAKIELLAKDADFCVPKPIGAWFYISLPKAP